MKTLEALNHLEAFDRIVVVSHITTEEKIEIGKEMLRHIPTNELFVSSHETLKAVTRSIRERVVALEATNVSTAAAPQETKEAPQEPKQPVRKARKDA